MNSFDLIKLIAIILALAVIFWFYRHYHKEKLSLGAQIKIAIIGFVSNLLDTIGIGSFAVIVAMRRLLGVMPDDVKLIGSMNIQAMITALAQALIFLHYIQLDLTTLLVAVTMIALGGFLSGLVVVRVNKKIVHRVMLIAFAITGVLLLLSQLNILEISGGSTAIKGTRLVIFAIFMLIAGALPAFGVGYYSLVKASIFLFGVNPIIAFPIMASASAYQMPVTSITFINKQKFYSKATILMAVFGVIGVLIAAPLISKVDSYTLKWILLGVVVYNVVTLARSAKTASMTA
jgi:uncharacterized membrane protein YfcA